MAVTRTGLSTDWSSSPLATSQSSPLSNRVHGRHSLNDTNTSLRLSPHFIGHQRHTLTSQRPVFGNSQDHGWKQVSLSITWLCIDNYAVWQINILSVVQEKDITIKLSTILGHGLTRNLLPCLLSCVDSPVIGCGGLSPSIPRGSVTIGHWLWRSLWGWRNYYWFWLISDHMCVGR